MDNLLYIAMSGAKENMNALAVRSNNLANASTIGFKADFENARAMQAYGEGLPTRVFSMAEEPGQNMSSGAIETTGRELDVAVKGGGWIAVEDSNGNEAYTRRGSLVLDHDGTLRTSDGRAVLAESGDHIELPALTKVEINQDGTVGGRPEGEGSEVFDGFVLLTRDEAARILKEGRDDSGNFYSVYTWAALMYFVNRMWKD